MKNIALPFPFPLQLFGCLLCLSIWSGNLSAQHTVSGFTPAKEKTMIENPVPFSQRWLKIKSNEGKVFLFAPVVEKTNHRLEFRKRFKTGEDRIFPANILDYVNIYQVDGGALVTFRLGSPGAKALRLKLSEVDLPEGAQMLVYAATTFSIAPNLNGLRYAYLPLAGQHLKILQEQAQPLGIVSGASYTKVFARGAIASIFGTNLTMSTEQAASLPLPTTLECVLFYASPTQINFLLPEYSVEAEEEFTVYVKRTDGYTSIGELKFSPVAPALFSASSDGQGVAAAVVQRVKGEVQTYEQVAELSGGKFVPRAINLGGDDEQVYRVLFGTGIRYRTDVSNVSANIGGTAFPVEYAGNQYYFSGVDQINILLPKSLRGKGVVPVSIIVDGKVSNTTKIKIAP